MRQGHDFDRPRGRDLGRVILRRFVQTAILAYWLPCFSVDFYVLWSWGHDAQSLSFVFWALFREALVFLALWVLVAGAQAMVFGGRRERAPGPPTGPLGYSV